MYTLYMDGYKVGVYNSFAAMGDAKDRITLDCMHKGEPIPTFHYTEM
jgi:hypothetical protein